MRYLYALIMLGMIFIGFVIYIQLKLNLIFFPCPCSLAMSHCILHFEVSSKSCLSEFMQRAPSLHLC
jgi:hypothetical protein